jgi:hypothetical protein
VGGCQWPISYSTETASEEAPRMNTDLDRTNKRPPVQRDEPVHRPCNDAKKLRGGRKSVGRR